MIDCQQALSLLQEILDKEINEIDENEVRQHLEKCSHCYDKFRLQESVQAFIDEKVKLINDKKTTSTDKLEFLRSNILDKLDEIDNECPDSGKGFFNSKAKILLATAALIVFVGISMLSAEFFRHKEYYIPLEQAHWTVSDNMPLFSELPDDIIEKIHTTYNYSVEPEFNGYTLAGSRQEKIMDTEFEHLVYSNGEDVVSIFITSADSFEIPEDLAGTSQIIGDSEIFDHNCRGCRLIYRKTGSLIMIAASTNHQLSLKEFAPGKQII